MREEHSFFICHHVHLVFPGQHHQSSLECPVCEIYGSSIESSNKLIFLSGTENCRLELEKNDLKVVFIVNSYLVCII